MNEIQKYLSKNIDDMDFKVINDSKIMVLSKKETDYHDDQITFSIRKEDNTNKFIISDYGYTAWNMTCDSVDEKLFVKFFNKDEGISILGFNNISKKDLIKTVKQYMQNMILVNDRLNQYIIARYKTKK